MPATKRYMNVSNVLFTPVSGQAFTMTGVTGISDDPAGTLEGFAADADRYNTTLVNNFNDPTLTVSLADVAVIAAMPVGTRGSLAYTLNDAKNLGGVGSFALRFVLANAVVMSNSFSAQHRTFAAGSIGFKTESADGFTNPKSYTVL